MGNVKTLVVKAINTPTANKHLSGIMAFSPTITKMCDIYGLAIVLADYEMLVSVDDEFGDMEAQDFLNMITCAVYTDDKGERLTVGKSISIKHQKSLKNCLVQLRPDGSNWMYYNKSELKVRDENFVVEVLRSELDDNKKFTGGVQVLYPLNGNDQEDIGNLIDVLRLGKYEDKDYELKTPTEHPNTQRAAQDFNNNLAAAAAAAALTPEIRNHAYSMKHLPVVEKKGPDDVPPGLRID